MDNEDEQLRQKVRELMVPGPIPPGAESRVHAAVRRRRWRIRAVAVASAVGAVLVGFAVVPLMGELGQPSQPGADDLIPSSGAWESIATSPLSARDAVASVYTGQEMLVVGGSTLEPCHDVDTTADCAGPSRDDVLGDGAAYDPSTDTWRRIAAAPFAFYGGVATWTDNSMVVLVPAVSGTQPSATLVYDPTADSWRELQPPPATYLGGGAWDGDQVLYWQSEEGRDRGDWALDIGSGWMQIPDDPFGPTYDRYYVWTGDGYLFLGRDAGGGPQRGHQVAEYDPATRQWNVLPESPVGFGDPRWFLHQGYVVNPFEDPRYAGDGSPMSGALDVKTGAWSTVPRTGRYSYDGCQIPQLGSAGEWLIGGGPALVSLEPRATTVAPACPSLPVPAAGAWTGEQVVIWGGPAEGYEGNSSSGLIWSPPTL